MMLQVSTKHCKQQSPEQQRTTQQPFDGVDRGESGNQLNGKKKEGGM